MGAKSVLIFLFLLTTLGLRFSQVRAARLDAGVIRVPHDFQTIQSAINAAQNGSTILVDEGVYYEHLTVNKTLTLLGVNEEDTIVDGSYSGDVVVITGDNVLFSGFTVRNSSKYTSGIYLSYSDGSTVTGNVVTRNGWAGIRLDYSDHNAVSDNIASSTTGMTVGLIFGMGIDLVSSANNIISDNVITDSLTTGVSLSLDHDNSILRNVIENNGVPMTASQSSHDTICQNNFIHNKEPGVGQIYSDNMMWSVGGRGNYWDDYVGLDDGSGNRTVGDGVGDTNLPWHGVDYYPLTCPVNPLRIFWNNQVFPCSLVSNSTVPAFAFDQTHKEITFNLIGSANTTGCFNLSTPAALLSGPWTVLLDGHDVTSEAAITENETYTAIYLNYSHSIHSVQIIGTNVVPEYPTATLLLLTPLTLPLAALAAKKRKRTNKRRSQVKNGTFLFQNSPEAKLHWQNGAGEKSGQ